MDINLVKKNAIYGVNLWSKHVIFGENAQNWVIWDIQRQNEIKTRNPKPEILLFILALDIPSGSTYKIFAISLVGFAHSKTD